MTGKWAGSNIPGIKEKHGRSPYLTIPCTHNVDYEVDHVNGPELDAKTEESATGNDPPFPGDMNERSSSEVSLWTSGPKSSLAYVESEGCTPSILLLSERK